ncbi:hypothetical protein T09_11467 [Trichinella sp. T9]|uniref:Uncharacterized protein n=1 Tax=Trichinella murrelli TaxID=144512 RepID=A0A0V0TJY4_9BILA|nr:hypothetical protein T05_8793 [Trichinella murrelli]KRX57388.1 hypothetical protein T09_11467 [Trichinella sp. T9]KRZ97501.1 hypothetical protein T08_14136 [Trichinella sp. T8]
MSERHNPLAMCSKNTLLVVIPQKEANNLQYANISTITHQSDELSQRKSEFESHRQSTGPLEPIDNFAACNRLFFIFLGDNCAFCLNEL